MDTSTVFVKTKKGHEEIEKRTYNLNFKHRTALIMVDGESTVNALLEKTPGDGIALLAQLQRDGFIAAADGTAAGLDVRSSDAASGATAGFDLATAKRNAVKFVEAVLGPGGESLAISIEGCATRAEFAKHALRTRDLISQVGGPRKGAEFWAKTGLPLN